MAPPRQAAISYGWRSCRVFHLQGVSDIGPFSLFVAKPLFSQDIRHVGAHDVEDRARSAKTCNASFSCALLHRQMHSGGRAPFAKRRDA